AVAALDRGIDVEADPDALVRLAQEVEIELVPAPGRDGRPAPEAASDDEADLRVAVDGHDITGRLRDPDVGRAVSTVAANADVRAQMVDRQRAWVRAHGGAVVEGRDIGSVVFPDADLKVFLTASAEERARRRNDETA